ncbi:chromosomal replication initiator protein DnaA [Truepera radiovictrix DSM 17093]|uniref:Chromosomal replication initiator protein DnaA n=1 Tax=Truepera radiovictrix (strain DSM 17093 / CIP 108686 / LMG 22925 / RQ-24) TaxID=649638 RepID=D7CWQ3_TRURR|nr:chromosomal replication initiator protein DnaA [Truepera radiovictrix]ADI13144.1 chromosomal replication initiator protein DnaA [Truepera radiovictrix DSM 17093]WMT58286.1 chromosomal replication initiator protein DnaA [Truepera radiovictrix]
MLRHENAIWDDILEYVRDKIPEVEFRTWFKQVRPLGIENGVFMIGVPHSFARDWLKNHYSPVLEHALKDLGAASPRVGFQVVSFPTTEQPDIFQPQTTGDDSSQVKRPRLNPKYVFSNFVVGPNNNLASAAALAVAEAPGRAYNPLFIYGDAGLGKTHLMHAVGHAVAERLPQLYIEYVTTEAFTNDLINAIREDRMTAFRDRYRSVDVLLVDDVQFIAGKERTQEEFFHTFNALYESGKQIILSSDRPPKDIPTLENRLRSRFEWGLITDIQAPELETRIAILKMNAEYRGVKIPPDVIDYIARQVTSNIRELEGALVRVILYASMNQVELNRQTVAAALSDVYAPSELNLSMEEILRATAFHFEADAEDLRSKGRRHELVVPRQVAMYLMRELTSHSYPEIGQFFSGRDHSTVVYAVQKVGEQLAKDRELEMRIQAIKSDLL